MAEPHGVEEPEVFKDRDFPQALFFVFFSPLHNFSYKNIVEKKNKKLKKVVDIFLKNDNIISLSA